MTNDEKMSPVTASQNNDGPPIAALAWLDVTGGARHVIANACSLGRSPSNDLVLAGEKVSRHHAIIQVHGENNVWLTDLGSSNGTYLNGKRLADPAQLYDGD